jgi:hypothetical protein
MVAEVVGEVAMGTWVWKIESEEGCDSERPLCIKEAVRPIGPWTSNLFGQVGSGPS